MKKIYPGSLHNHTQYSNLRLRDCIIKENDLIDYAIELGQRAVAITDHETLSQAVKIEKYYTKIKAKFPEFKVIRGNEIYLCRNGLNATNFNAKKDKYYHFVLLAKDLVGFRQLSELSTRAWQRSYMARGMRRVPTYYQDLIDIIGANPGHVIGSTACLGGALGTQILKGTNDEVLISWISKMNNLFGEGNFFLEMQPSKNKEQILVNRKICELSEKTKVDYIITTDSHYLKKEDRVIHKAYLNAQNGDREVDSFYGTTYLMGTEEIEQYMGYSFDNLDVVHKAYDSINKIIDSCKDYSILKPLKIPELSWKIVKNYSNEYDEWTKKIPELKTFIESPYKSDRYLVNAIIEGIYSHDDLKNENAYSEINENLKMTWISSEVNKAHWSAYCLNLQKIIDECWNAGSIVGPGRGSGVGFILLYVLGITQINPLRETTKTFSWRLTHRV